MRYFFIILAFLLCACHDQNHKDIASLPSMTGGLNELIIVLEEPLWKSSLGDSLRVLLGAQVPGIPWQEPIFDLVQIPPKTYSSIFVTHRNLLFFEKGSKPSVGFQENANSRGQLMALVTYQDKEQLSSLIQQYGAIIAHKFQEMEKTRLSSQIVLQKGLEPIYNKHKIKLSIPKGFELVVDTPSFSWMEFSPSDKEIIQGLFIYEVEPETPFTLWELLAQRDSILKKYVPGETKGSYMATEMQYYNPWVKHIESMGFNALEIKGVWKMQNAFMGGPFITHFIEDTSGGRIVALEGFLFHPTKDKRDKMLQLQLILESAKKQL